MSKEYGRGGDYYPKEAPFALLDARSLFMEILFEEIPEALDELIKNVYPIYKNQQGGISDFKNSKAYYDWANKYKLENNTWICEHILNVFRKTRYSSTGEEDILKEQLRSINPKAYWDIPQEKSVTPYFEWDPKSETKREAEKRAKEAADRFYNEMMLYIQKIDKDVEKHYSKQEPYYKTRKNIVDQREHMRWFVQKNILGMENKEIIQKHRENYPVDTDKQIEGGYNIASQLNVVAKRIGWIRNKG